jgi:tryptophanyl-tRNA synthetase
MLCNMKDKKHVLLSGIQSTGRLHIGNYFGAMKQFVEFQEQHDMYVSVVNYHSLTTVQDGDQLRENTYNAVLDHLAIGLDPEKATLFLQSDIPEVTELAWIFDCLVTVPQLERAHAFKDKTAKGIEATMGLFNYPVLMAADILIMNGELIPVGEDQRQHIEIAREIARKFNNQYGELFVEPQEYIPETVAVVPGIDGQKMSKSYHNTIPLFGTDAEIKKAVMSIVTDSAEPADSKNPDENHIFNIFKLLGSDEQVTEMREGFEKGGLGYGDAKKMLLAAILDMIQPMRERRLYYEQHPEIVAEILTKGKEKARARAVVIMEQVRQKVGLTF